ncbi:MAG: hypothetical protein EXX96DRAFT_455897, partial [Benjaminiella poitrasii]
KCYNNLLKLILFSKIQLDELLEDVLYINQEKIKKVKMPFCVVSTTCYVYSLCLVSDNLYLVEDAC